MTFQFRTFQIGSARQPGEGLRIGAVRFLPRGVHKTEYSKRDLFDVWLPSLAPSRDLLKQFKSTGMQKSTRQKRYRSEMAETEAAQTIKLLAELAKRTPISIGCYCVRESACHRSVLGELVRVAAGEPAKKPYSAACVYTIKHPEDLEALWKDDGEGELSERKPWTTAARLLEEAQSQGEVLPIAFADATACARLTFWGHLESIEIDGGMTTYRVSQLRRVSRGHSTQDLVLLSTGESIAPGFIKPYALVHRPKFIRQVGQ